MYVIFPPIVTLAVELPTLCTSMQAIDLLFSLAIYLFLTTMPLVGVILISSSPIAK